MSNRIKNTAIRSEEWQQKDGEGILEIRGDERDIMLLFNGVPLVFEALDCEGSIGRFTVMLSDENLSEATELVEQAAASGFTAPAPLHEQIAPLLRLLPHGNYCLRLEQVHDYGTYLFSDYIWIKGVPDTIWYYPDYARHQTLLWTQPESSLDDATINKYMAVIDNGQRPALITIGSRHYSTRFILDGHHKQFAYWCCGMGPYTLHIEFQDSKPIPVEFVQNLLSRNLSAESYLKVKSQITRFDHSR